MEETDRETVAEGEGDAVGEGAPFIVDPAQRPNRRTPEKAMALSGDIEIFLVSFWQENLKPKMQTSPATNPNLIKD